MKNVFFGVLLFAISFGTYSQSLDSLILKGQKGINRIQHLKSFIPGNGSKETPTKSYVMRGPSLYMAQAQRVDDLEASVIKLTIICDNLQKQSDSHSDNQELFLKLFEILFGGIVSIVIAVMGYKFSKKSGQSLPADGPG
jgi:hypothetical protein